MNQRDGGWRGRRISTLIGFCLLVVGCLVVVCNSSVRAEVLVDTGAGQPIHLMVNRLAKLKASSLVSRAHIVNPAIAELVYSSTQSPQWIFVSGKSVGTTQLTLWDANNSIIGSFDVIVVADATGLKKSLHEIFPRENVKVQTSGDKIVLSGTVSDAMTMTKVLTLASTYVPSQAAQEGAVGALAGAPAGGGGAKESNVINLLQVGGVQQVMLEVRIAEMSKSLGHQLGINFAWAGSKALGVSLLDNLTSIPEDGWPGNPITISDSINAALGFFSGDTLIVSIDALQENGLLHILAKPTLIDQSGQNASFLAGGEFPFPVATAFDTFAIHWKPFGVALNFTPTVLSDDTISLVVSPEVSDLDFSNTVSYAGYTIPAIDTRRMSTVVELKDNQSFAIAGLLKNYVRQSVAKFPILGEIPIIGALFRSSAYQKDETELVVIVTPHLVKPVDADTLPLPTDTFESATPFEFMMLGMTEKYHNPEATPMQANEPPAENAKQPPLQGEFGYIIPE